jgi:uncharacterized membrane protein YqjE
VGSEDRLSETRAQPPAHSGPAARISASLIEGIHLRLELFALEMSQERDRIVERVVLCVVLALAAFLLLLCLHAALLVVFWESHRVQIAIGMVTFYALVVVASLLLLRRRSRAHEEPFTATHRVLNQDIEGLRDLGKPQS